MPTDTEHLNEQSTTSLMAGIVADVELLVKQQLELTRQEIMNDYHKAQNAAMGVVLMLIGFTLGAILCCFALVHFLHWVTTPITPADAAWLPLWACHGIVGMALAVIGGGLAWVTISQQKPIDPLHNPAVEGLKENVDWLTHPK